MAEKRMFSRKIVLSDAFLDMPMSARCLYFTLSMLADDDGFVDAPKSIMRQCGASQDDMGILLAKRFVLNFESGVVVIKHWLINNYLRSDRYTETTYLEEKSTLCIDENGAYTEKESYEPLPETVGELVGIPTGIPTGIPSIDKDSKDKSSKEKNGKKGVFQEFAGENKALLEALKEFNSFRNLKKKPMTDAAKRRLVNKLEEKFPKEQWIDIIHQSIDNGWTDIYGLKGSDRYDTRGSGQKQSVYTNAPESSGSGGKQWNLKHN